MNWHKGDSTEFRTFGDKFRTQSDKTTPFYTAKAKPSVKPVKAAEEENPLPEKESPEAEAELMTGYEYGWIQPWESTDPKDVPAPTNLDAGVYHRKIPG